MIIVKVNSINPNDKRLKIFPKITLLKFVPCIINNLILLVCISEVYVLNDQQIKKSGIIN